MHDLMDALEGRLNTALSTTPNLVLEDARRLTGPGLLWSRPGAVLDILFQGYQAEQIISLWQHHAPANIERSGLVARTPD